MSKTFKLTWEIDIVADTHEEAAEQALRIQRDPESIATCFTVQEEGQKKRVFIDLNAEPGTELRTQELPDEADPEIKVAIEINGGNVSMTYSNRKDVKIAIIDLDNYDEEENRGLVSIALPQRIAENFHELYEDIKDPSAEKTAYDILKEENF